MVRSALLQWEDKSKDVVGVVCHGVFSPLWVADIKPHGQQLNGLSGG
jgi:hypothetical protein